MDPIHPIVPVPPTIPSVNPAPLIGRLDREEARRDADENQRRRRRPRPQPDTDGQYTLLDEREGDDDSGLHINVTA